MGRTIYYTATSLDGFIATPEHNLDWLVSRDVDNDGPMGYNAFIAQVGALVMGASTYAWLREHGGDTWSYDVPCWVMTHRSFDTYPGADINFAEGDVAAVHQKLVAAAGDRNVWVVGGGDLAGQFADAGLLDEILVSVAPVTLGAGAPLLPRRIELRLTDLGRNGEFACMTYEVVR